jgi:MFS family permease
VVAGYGVSFAMLLVLGGRLGDTFGRRRLFLVGLVGFVFASAVCGLAPSVGALIGARIVQGAAAAALLPQVLATLQATLDGERRARAFGFYAASAGVAIVAGQLLGGVLVSADLDGTGWRGVFLLNLPIGVAGLLAALRWVPETKAARAPGTDPLGTALLTLAVLALLLPLTEGRALGWPLWSWLLLAAVVPLAAGFGVVERRIERSGRTPLVPPSLLRVPGLALGLVVAAVFFACFSGLLFGSAVALQTSAGFSPLGSGLTFVPLGVAFLAGSLSAARLSTRFGRIVMTLGALGFALGILGMAVTVLVVGLDDVRPWMLAPAMVVAGLGQGCFVPPLFRAMLAGVPAAEAGVAGGIVTTTQQTAIALGVAALGGLFLAVADNGYVVSLLTEAGFVLLAAVATCWFPRRAS